MFSYTEAGTGGDIAATADAGTVTETFHTYADPGDYDIVVTNTDTGQVVATDTVTVAA